MDEQILNDLCRALLESLQITGKIPLTENEISAMITYVNNRVNYHENMTKQGATSLLLNSVTPQA